MTGQHTPTTTTRFTSWQALLCSVLLHLMAVAGIWQLSLSKSTPIKDSPTAQIITQDQWQQAHASLASLHQSARPTDTKPPVPRSPTPPQRQATTSPSAQSWHTTQTVHTATPAMPSLAQDPSSSESHAESAHILDAPDTPSPHSEPIQASDTNQTGTPTPTPAVSQAQLAQITTAVTSRIIAVWEQYQDHAGKKLTTTISIDEQGYVTDIRFGSGNAELQSSIASAIRQSEPFGELAGLTKKFTVVFHTTPPKDDGAAN